MIKAGLQHKKRIPRKLKKGIKKTIILSMEKSSYPTVSDKIRIQMITQGCGYYGIRICNRNITYIQAKSLQYPHVIL